jgi:uncharacterized protein involved in exopolysaccharide biosynthesis
MSLAQFLAILVARRWMIVAAVCASLVGAALVVMIVPPRYTASTRVLLNLIKPDPVTGQVIGGQFAQAYTQTQTALIKDIGVAGAVVDDLHWSSDPTMLARYAVPGDPDAARHRMAQLIIDHTDAKLIQGSNIMEISYTGWSPDAAKAIADSIRRQYMQAAVSVKRQSAAESADWYQQRADAAQRLLAMAENAKTEFEREHDIIMQDDKNDVDSERLAALSSVAAAPPAASIMPYAPGTSPAATDLATVEAQLAVASRTLGASNPVMIQLRQKRDALSNQVAEERRAASAAGAAASSAANAASVAAGATQRQLEAQKSRVLANRDNLAKLRQLQSEVDVRRDQYVKAAQAAADLRAQSTTEDSGVTVLNNAVAPEQPSFPNGPLIFFGSLALGVVLGILAALLTELLNRRIRTARDLQDFVEGVPLLAVVSSASVHQNSGWWKWIKLPRRRREEALAA